MPLSERDLNTQRETPRNKRTSSRLDVKSARMGDENSPSPRGTGIKATSPPPQRLLRPTKASAAKVASPQRQAGRSTPQPHSKLPRRAFTPNTTPSTSRCSTRLTDRFAHVNKAESGLTENGTEVGTLHPHEEASQSDFARSSLPDFSQSSHLDLQRTIEPPMDKLLWQNKPLPSHPVMSFINEPSPSKNGRTLLDASDQPLLTYRSGGHQDWPSLTPASSSETSMAMVKDGEAETPDQFTSIIITSSGAAAVLLAATEHASDMVAKTSISSAESDECVIQERCLSPTTMTAVGYDLQASHTDEADDEEHKQVDFPPRHISLRSRIASSIVSASSPGLRAKFTGFTNIPEHGTHQEQDSRPHSPSPASFSRPRPSSVSHARRLPSPSETGATLEATVSPRAQKTASRIPIPDIKKATLVEIKPRRSSGALTPMSENGPSFGTRRLDAPDTLKILDQGVKRRQLTQLTRTNTNGSIMTSDSSSTIVSKYMATPMLDQSRTSSRDRGFDPSSSDDEEVTTPVDRAPAGGFVGLQFGTERPADSYYRNTAVKLFDGAVSAFARAPPPTSPFTLPLLTIPSQDPLPFHTEDITTPVTNYESMSSGFTTMHKRFSDLHAAHADYTASHVNNHAPVPESTRYSLIELLSEYEREDMRLGQDGFEALDEETRKHITRTLSLLEGNGSPPETEVDSETLLRMFGHLKRGLEKAPHTASLLENAAAAEKYMARTSSRQARDIESPAGTFHQVAYSQAEERLSGGYNSPSQFAPIENVPSKWSDSTSSLTGFSPPTKILYQPAAYEVQRDVPSKRSPPKPSRSFVYRPRTSSKTNAAAGPSEIGTSATPDALLHRTSPDTSARRKPGSVRTARETLPHVRGGFATTTASAQSKKMAKLPTPTTRQGGDGDEEERGRAPSGEASKQYSVGAAGRKTPRTRSKSRYVLDKINGLFSGKREKKRSPAPPVPSADDTRAADRHHLDLTTNGSPVSRTAQDPPFFKVPTYIPSAHPAFRSAPATTTTRASVATPADSVTSSEDGQALQNWSASLISKAQRETDTTKKSRLLNFAKVLNDSLISAREAQISAETALQAATRAQLSFELTQKSIAMLHRLAASMSHGGRG